MAGWSPKCCDKDHPLYGCPEEICPGCYDHKGHDDYHCTANGCSCEYMDCHICNPTK